MLDRIRFIKHCIESDSDRKAVGVTIKYIYRAIARPNILTGNHTKNLTLMIAVNSFKIYNVLINENRDGNGHFSNNLV
jgi:hypothetical protein